MKSSSKGLFVILLIVMSLVAVPGAFAGSVSSNYNGPGEEPGPPERIIIDYCTTVVSGYVTYVSSYDGVIVVADETTVNGLPLWLNIKVDDFVVINVRVSPDGKYVACYLTINDGTVINLR